MTSFTVGEAWSQSIAFLRDNMRMLLILIGGAVLVSTIFELVLSGSAESQAAQLTALFEALQSGESRRIEQAMQVRNAGLLAVPVAILASLIQSAANFAALRLGLGRGDEGVGPALSYGLGAAVLTSVAYLVGAIVIGGIVMVLVVMLGFGGVAAGGAGGVGIVFLLIIMLACVAVWLMARLAVVAPTMAAAQSVNPLYGIAQSWALTRGQVMPIVGFFVLFGLVAIVASIVLGGVTVLASAMLGPIVGGLLGGVVISAPVNMLSSAVQAGMFRTLAPDIAIGDVFS